MKNILAVLFLVVTSGSFGKDEYKYGKVTKEELAEKYYKKDSLTGAVILYSIGEIKNSIYSKHEKIKIYDKNAFGLANQTMIIYNPKFSGNIITLYNIKGKAYNLENGKIVEDDLTKKAFRIDKLDDYHDIVHFTFSNVKEGSIIEYEIQLSGVGTTTWYFQQYYPVEYSEFQINIPEFYKFRRDTKGYLNIPMPEEDIYTESYHSYGYEDFSYQINKTTWKMKNIPAFVSEPFMYCKDNYISQINHELLSVQFPRSLTQNFTTNWTEVLTKLLESSNHGKLLNNSSSFLNIEYDKVKGIKDNVERMNACYNEIQRSMSWNGSNGIFSLNLKEAHKETKGSAADINFILLRLLKDCNIESYPVILSTRENGFVPMFPSFGKFNYLIVLAKVNGQSYLLDATEKYLPPNILPTRCLNGQGLVVKEGLNIQWVDLSPKQNATVINSTEIKLSNDGNLKGKSTFKRSGYAAWKLRVELGKNASENKQEWILDKSKSDLQITNYMVINKDSLQLPVVENFEFNSENLMSENTNTILLEPVFFEKWIDNPFKSPERFYPVEFPTPIDNTYIVNITLPENMSVEEKPKSVVVNMPDNSAKFTYQLSLINNTIQLTAKLNIKNTIYSQDQYPFLKEFYSQVISKFNEPLLLKIK